VLSSPPPAPPLFPYTTLFRSREIVLGTGLPRKVPGFTVGKACASSNQAITSAADMIFRGYAEIVVAGGSESLSDIPILFSKNFRSEEHTSELQSRENLVCRLL